MQRVVAALMLAATAVGCAQPVAVGEASELVPLDGDTWAIVSNEGEIAVYPNVIALTCHGGVAWGMRALATGNTDGSAPFSTGLGYFLFFPESGALNQGLSREQLVEALAVMEIDFHEPHRVESTDRLQNGCG